MSRPVPGCRCRAGAPGCGAGADPLPSRRISYCTTDKLQNKVFAYVAQSQQSGALECHAFLSPKKKIVSTSRVCDRLREPGSPLPRHCPGPAACCPPRTRPRPPRTAQPAASPPAPTSQPGTGPGLASPRAPQSQHAPLELPPRNDRGNSSVECLHGPWERGSGGLGPGTPPPSDPLEPP